MSQITEAISILIVVLHLVTSLGLSVVSTEVDGFNENIFTVKAKVSETLSFTHKLSKNQVFGFETVSELSEKDRTELTEDELINQMNQESSLGDDYFDIGVNGAFYNDFGRAVGILIIDGELITKQVIKAPMFILRYNGEVELINPELSTYIVHEGVRYETFEVNEGLTDTLVGVFTNWYGSSNRRSYNHSAIIVEDGVVKSIEQSGSAVSIPYLNTNLMDNDFMIAYRNLNYELPIMVGDDVTFEMESNFDHESVREGFQTGGWLVLDGENVALTIEGYLGESNSLQPRTAIGITASGEIILKVVDGRNKGVSEGVTGYQLADLMIADGCVSAAYLDGGASSTMVKLGEVLNEPSLGEEKGVAHALFFDKDYQKVVAK